MRRLGAIIAGGNSIRFGSDKGAFALAGKAMIDRIAEYLRPRVDALVVVGRAWPDLESVSDLPKPGLGPLGGLCGALTHGEARGFAYVLTAGCDTLPVPVIRDPGDDGRPVIVSGQPLIGNWPVSLAGPLAGYLAGTDDYSVWRWVNSVRAHRVDPCEPVFNVNRKEDVAAVRDRLSLP